MEQKLIKPDIKVLDENGIPNQFGYNKKCVCDFNREDIAGCKMRLKEWDFYQINNTEWMVQITIGHASIAGTANISIINLLNGYVKNYTIPLFVPTKLLNMPDNGDKHTLVEYNKYGKLVRFEVGENCRNLTARNPQGLKLDLHLTDNCEGILVCTPFKKPHQFYYNYKKNCMEVTGSIVFEDKKIVFDPKDSFCLIDWGRGVLPYNHKWWWGNGTHRLPDGKLFGFNLGVFGDNHNATENMLFYDNKATKIEEVFVEKDGWLDKWKYTSSDGRFEMEFTPFYVHKTSYNFLVINNKCHQVWGKFNGFAIVDDNTKIEIKDMIAFTEFAHNHW
ncbi:MAG: DUF2804 domain-containing protein [Clostridia bacterium]